MQIDAATLGIIVGSVTLVLGIIKLVSIVLSIGVRLGTLETEHRFLIQLVLGDAKMGAVQKGILHAQSPLRVDPKIAQFFNTISLGSELKATYRDQHLDRFEDAGAIWKLYTKFKDRLEPEICLPLKINITEALFAALQYCRDGAPPPKEV